ncbi:hypothetical protein [Arthrobacter sp. MA-N2]|uniref:hypothetical protein n=1 Tax=Arthrobacter sp. MA-N2 TaxID=1101188 RepID=UPI000480D3EA|nr:hypothetical protein [Arthrobacter sp. MA-N2]
MLLYALLQEALEGMDKKSAVAHLLFLFPDKSKSFFDRNYMHILTLDPLGLSRILGHSDPTANKAIRNIERKVA